MKHIFILFTVLILMYNVNLPYPKTLKLKIIFPAIFVLIIFHTISCNYRVNQHPINCEITSTFLTRQNCNDYYTLNNCFLDSNYNETMSCYLFNTFIGGYELDSLTVS